MARAIATPMHKGERISALTQEAVGYWFDTARDKRRRDWVELQLGPDGGLIRRALDVAGARVHFPTAPGLATWSPTLRDTRDGTPALLLPVWVCDPGAWTGHAVLDLVAIEPDGARRIAARAGICEALGEADAYGALQDAGVIHWQRDALAWLHAIGRALRAGVAAGAQFMPFASPCRIADQVLLSACSVIVGDDAIAHQLNEDAAALRARLAPRRVTVLVDDDQVASEAA